jgi:hypothetical protein
MLIKVFRLFESSTFADFLQEREALAVGRGGAWPGNLTSVDRGTASAPFASPIP